MPWKGTEFHPSVENFEFCTNLVLLKPQSVIVTDVEP